MSISKETRTEVRARAGFACEYCNVSERDVGGELTVDHYRPLAAGGSDDLENLVYACHRCNLYKGTYWNDDVTAPRVWNPRESVADEHFWLSSNGRIYGLTEIAVFTIRRLRLNRLVIQAHRRRLFEQAASRKLLEQTQKAAELLARSNEQQRRLLEEQQRLLEEQQKLLRILLESKIE